MLLRIDDIGGEIVKDNETYVLRDNKQLKNLVLSSTTLHPRQSTRGHFHAGQEEVYFFISGKGMIELQHIDGSQETYEVESGDVVLIPDGSFHKVHNRTDEELYFVCVFDGKRNH